MNSVFTRTDKDVSVIFKDRPDPLVRFPEPKIIIPLKAKALIAAKYVILIPNC